MASLTKQLLEKTSEMLQQIRFLAIQNSDPPTEKIQQQKGKQECDEGKIEDVKLKPKEIGGPAGPEPTRYGDWERKGRVSDF